MARRARRRVAVVTGTRAEFGLLRPVMDAIKARTDLELLVVAGGAHLLPPARTIREVESAYRVAAKVPMQKPGVTGRSADAAALGRGVSGFAAAFGELEPDWVVVLGDRIEALAAASAASVAGIAVCHIHGGDRAEGVADEAMRHAISKLAHLHAAASAQSRERLIKMGEKPEHVFNVGSPAIDGLRDVRAMSERAYAALGRPRAVVLLHPAGLEDAMEQAWAVKTLARVHAFVDPRFSRPSTEMFEGVLVLAPNSDAGRENIEEVWAFAAALGARLERHLPRDAFLALLKRLAGDGGVLFGNSSAGLIEAAALGVAVVNFGPRQAGRERAGNVLDIPEIRAGTGEAESAALRRLIARLRRTGRAAHPFGPGRTGPSIAALLARVDPRDPDLLRKRNTY